MLIPILGTVASLLGAYNMARFAGERAVRVRRKAKRAREVYRNVKALRRRLDSVDKDAVLSKVRHILDTHGTPAGDDEGDE
jgi:hypothetical protein